MRTPGSGRRGGQDQILDLLGARRPRCAGAAARGIRRRGPRVSTAWPSAGTEAWSQQLVSGRGEQACGTLK